jgi:hypothetical protein
MRVRRRRLCEIAKLSDAGGGPADSFAVDLAIDGDVIVVGDYEYEGSGVAYVYRRNGFEWSLEALLRAPVPDPDDAFAVHVAVGGDWIAVGADQAAVPALQQGTVHIFRRDRGRWTHHSQLVASDGAAFDNFGIALAIEGDVLAVGARGKDHLGLMNAGALYVFRFVEGAWVEETKLIDPAPAAFGTFGHDVALAGGRMLVSAGGHDLVYVFRAEGAAWQLEATLSAEPPGQVFGASIALSADRAIVGAPYYDFQIGAAYVFQRNGCEWKQEAMLLGSDPQGPQPLFGVDVAITHNGSTVIVGAHVDYEAGFHSGAAYLFRHERSGWVEITKFVGSDTNAGDFFGRDVAAFDDVAVVGATRTTSKGGAAYVFAGIAGIDCNENGMSDACDVFGGTAEDANGDWIPDACQVGDIDGDGVVGLADLLVVLASWGACPDCVTDCAADLHGDCTVGFPDLLTVLANWS